MQINPEEPVSVEVTWPTAAQDLDHDAGSPSFNFFEVAQGSDGAALLEGALETAAAHGWPAPHNSLPVDEAPAELVAAETADFGI